MKQNPHPIGNFLLCTEDQPLFLLAPLIWWDLGSLILMIRDSHCVILVKPMAGVSTVTGIVANISSNVLSSL